VILDSTVFVASERRGESVVDLLIRLDNAFADEPLAISVVTAAELLHGIWRANRMELQAARQAFVEEILMRITVRNMNLRVARVAARLDADTQTRGITIPPSDLWIAATALEAGFKVATGNTRHFASIPGLETVRFA
jgi:predicted nucleic acid-binding protein